MRRSVGLWSLVSFFGWQSKCPVSFAPFPPLWSEGSALSSLREATNWRPTVDVISHMLCDDERWCAAFVRETLSRTYFQISTVAYQSIALISENPYPAELPRSLPYVTRIISPRGMHVFFQDLPYIIQFHTSFFILSCEKPRTWKVRQTDGAMARSRLVLSELLHYGLNTY